MDINSLAIVGTVSPISPAYIERTFEDVESVVLESHEAPDGDPSCHYYITFKDGSRALCSITARPGINSPVPVSDYAVRATEIAGDLHARFSRAEAMSKAVG